MRFFIGPVSCLPVFLTLAALLSSALVQAQFSQDFRASKSFSNIRFPGSTRPRTQLIQPQPQARPRPQQQQFQPQQQQFQSQPQQFRPSNSPLRDEVTQNAASNAANLALNSQRGSQGAPQSGRLVQPNQPAAIAQQTNFLTNRLPVPGVPTDELFTFADSRRVRYSPDLAEQRAIADQQEFLLLQGTSARFLNRKTNSAEFAATLIGPDQQSAPIPFHEGFRSLPAFPTAQSAALQASPAVAVNPVAAAFQAADPFVQTAYPTEAYAQPPPAPYPQPAAPYAQPPPPPPAAPYQQPIIDPYSSYGASGPYQTSESYSYQSLPSSPDAGFNYGYDVYHG